jgi:hypothetical protein
MAVKVRAVAASSRNDVVWPPSSTFTRHVINRIRIQLGLWIRIWNRAQNSMMLMDPDSESGSESKSKGKEKKKTKKKSLLFSNKLCLLHR